MSQLKWTSNGMVVTANYDDKTTENFHLGHLFHEAESFDDVERLTAMNGLKRKLVDKVAEKSSTADKKSLIHATWVRLTDERKWNASGDGTGSTVAKAKAEATEAKEKALELQKQLTAANESMAKMLAEFQAMKIALENATAKKGKKI